MGSAKSEVQRAQEKAGMKQGSVISASLVAIVSSLATMACCVPLGFAGALGAAGRKRVSAEVPAVAAGALHPAAGRWILAGAPREVVRSEAELLERRAALDGPSCSLWR